LLLAHSPGGLEERDADGQLEIAVYTTAAGESVLRDALEPVFGEVASAPVAAGWEHAWRSFHRPVVAAGVWIGPPWEVPPAGARTVVIDPGLAFGTGAHATTRLCVELLAEAGGGSLLDVGCGSGVLAIAAVRLGYGPVAALDVDPTAVEVTRANATANGATLDAMVVDAASDPLPAADVLVANVALDVVETVLGRIGRGRAVTSGYLVGERPQAPGWTPLARRGLDGWAADLLERQ
jgi:ribosomal protein L11 methyltransferase